MAPVRAAGAGLVAALAQQLLNPFLFSESSPQVMNNFGSLVQGTIGLFSNDAAVQCDLHAQFGISAQNEI